jgi:hypothetical protein
MIVTLLRVSAADVRDARRTTDAALLHIEAADPDAPLFEWVHYIDRHVSYHPEVAVAERFDPEESGRFHPRRRRRGGG